MRISKSAFVSLSLVVGLVAASLLLTGCPKKKGLREGGVYLAALEIEGDGALYAYYIEGMGGDCKDDGYLDKLRRACEEGDDKACEELEQAQEKHDGKGDRGFGFYTRVDSVDRLGQSFVVLGVLTVVESEADDAERRDFGDYEQVEIQDLEAGDWVKASGRCDEDGVFHAEAIWPVEAGKQMIWAELWDLTDKSFTMLGLEIAYDSETKIANKGHKKGGKDEPRK